MEFFNYVMVLASVIVGLAVTHLLQGVAKMIQHPDRKQLYWVHLAWVALMFLNVLFVWWWEFQLAGVRHWTFELYVFVLSFSVVLYLICAVLMPSAVVITESSDTGDYTQGASRCADIPRVSEQGVCSHRRGSTSHRQGVSVIALTRIRLAPTSIEIARTNVRRIAPTIERYDRTDTRQVPTA